MATDGNFTNRFGIDKHMGDMGDHPQFRVLTDEKLERIHEATAEILETIGVKVQNAEVREMMGKAGCPVEDDIVTVPRQLLEDSIDLAPRRSPSITEKERKHCTWVAGKSTPAPDIHLWSSSTWTRVSGGTTQSTISSWWQGSPMRCPMWT